jgi:S-adenosylmethionine/arginine decarboxylase-like enzyme
LEIYALEDEKFIEPEGLDHKHFLLKANVKRPPKTEEDMNRWLKEVVDLIQMKIVVGPTSRYVDTPGNEGVTGTVTIETSHLACHVWDHIDPGLIQLDIYSCKCFDPSLVLKKVDEDFGIVKSHAWFINRNGNTFSLENFI